MAFLSAFAWDVVLVVNSPHFGVAFQRSQHRLQRTKHHYYHFLQAVGETTQSHCPGNFWILKVMPGAVTRNYSIILESQDGWG